MRKNISTLCYLAIIFMVSSCQMNSGESQGNSDMTAADTSENQPTVNLSSEDFRKVKDLIESVSPPTELTHIINDLDIKFSPSVLNPVEKADSYNGSREQALALGVYSCDLVYCYVYNRTDLTASYLEAIQKLAAKLKLEQVINFDRLKEINDERIDNNDLAMEFTTQMEKVNQHLQSSNQIHLSSLVSFGGWIESIYVASIVGKEIGEYSEDMIELIYYESIMSESFMEIFQKLNHLPGYDDLLQDVATLSEMYDKVEVELEKVDAKVVYHDEMTSVMDVSEQSLNYEKEEFQQIIDQIQLIRKEAVK